MEGSSLIHLSFFLAIPIVKYPQLTILSLYQKNIFFFLLTYHPHSNLEFYPIFYIFHHQFMFEKAMNDDFIWKIGAKKKSAIEKKLNEKREEK